MRTFLVKGAMREDPAPRYYEGGNGTAASHDHTCVLHARRCAVLGCDQETVLHPVCPIHAPGVFGVRVAPSGDIGLGLFATTAFRRGDPIVPYLGQRHPTGAIRCPYAAGPARSVSPYALRMGSRWVHDASCCRSYASMANHPDPPRRSNTVFRPRRPRIRARHRSTAATQRPLRGGAPAAETTADAVPPHGPWLVATRVIAPGEEILVHYGPQWRRIIGGVRHATEGAGAWWCMSTNK